jgi:hypothetical protein
MIDDLLLGCGSGREVIHPVSVPWCRRATGCDCRLLPPRGCEIIATCREHGLVHEVATERGGDRFLTRLVSVTSPSGITVWFEGPNEADTADA